MKYKIITKIVKNSLINIISLKIIKP